VLGRATVALVLGLAALAAGTPACTPDSPDDPVSPPGNAGIPMGAVGAVGVSFEAPTRPAGEGVDPAPKPLRRKPEGKRRPLPPDPFADPPDTSGSGNDGGTTPAPASRHSGGTAL
jgi:hypothetical protein